jgi:hypothetical protein
MLIDGNKLIEALEAVLEEHEIERLDFLPLFLQELKRGESDLIVKPEIPLNEGQKGWLR